MTSTPKRSTPLARPRSVALATLALLGVVLTGCGTGTDTTSDGPEVEPGAPTVEMSSEPATSPSSEPPPAPAPDFDWNDSVVDGLVSDVFGDVPKGNGVARAASYAGARHPMVVLGVDNYMAEDLAPLFKPENVNEVQLVASFDRPKNVDVGSCGVFKTSDGRQGELLLYEVRRTVRVFTAQTGDLLAKMSGTDPAPSCPPHGEYFSSKEDPPWYVINYEETRWKGASDAFEWLEEFLTGPVRNP